MKTILLSILSTAVLVSCSKNSLEPAAPAAAPEGANPYGVPGGDLPNYAPEAAAYQPIDPINPPASAPAPVAAPTPIAPAPVTTPPAVASSHLVVKGDSLWGLSQKYGVTVEALQQANGLTGTQINTGQSLAIPVAP